MPAPGLLKARHELDVRMMVRCSDGPGQSGVTPHRVHRDVYVDPAVFEAELSRIFARTWVYVGHESEVAQPGSFTTTTIGRQPVILTRTESGEVVVLLNRCTHRAATVCQERRGQTRFFRCPYHGWSFRPDGTLVGFTFADGYDDPDLCVGDFTLGRAARVDSYRGFVFASLAADGPSLAEHLGNAAPYIDLLADLSPNGQLQLGTAGESRYSYPGNWKIQCENGVDGYHANFVHLATLLPDGSPHSVAIWADAHDDDHVVFFTSPSSRKARNLDGDARLAMSLVDRANPYRKGMLRGRVVGRIEGDDGRAIVDRISHKYTGEPFPYPSELAFVVEVTHSRLFSLDDFEDRPAT